MTGDRSAAARRLRMKARMAARGIAARGSASDGVGGGPISDPCGQDTDAEIAFNREVSFLWQDAAVEIVPPSQTKGFHARARAREVTE